MNNRQAEEIARNNRGKCWTDAVDSRIDEQRRDRKEAPHAGRIAAQKEVLC